MRNSTFWELSDSVRVVKEEISDDNAKLPCFNGRVVSWALVLAGKCLPDSPGQAGSGQTVIWRSHTDLPPPLERTGGIGDSRPPSFHPNAASSRDGLDNETGTESVISHRRERHRRRIREGHEDGILRLVSFSVKGLLDYMLFESVPGLHKIETFSAPDESQKGRALTSGARPYPNCPDKLKGCALEISATFPVLRGRRARSQEVKKPPSLAGKHL
uniref:Uncharacterized protein n=1 Tax=Sphaerodactylus townsendi TaxID=933632 RepID=A0ACB8EES7_9SAUR